MKVIKKLCGECSDKAEICGACNGSGEGMHERTTCCVCGGSGAVISFSDLCVECRISNEE